MNNIMKTFKFLMPFLLVAFTFVGCNTDDLRNDIDELKNRVESLEALVSTMNDNVNALKVFAEGGVTISSYEKVGDTYKLVLSDGRTIELTQGQQGDVDVPSISISEDGCWIINGVKQEDKKAVGANADAPKFTIKKETVEGAEKAYWYVDYNDGKGYVQVKDPEGNPVEATTSGEVNIKPDFFEKVEVKNGCMEVTLTTEPKGPFSLPIVEGLICKIETEGVEEYKDNILTVGYGRKVTLQVEVTGETQILTAPAGWTAELGTLTDGKGELTITAPQAPVATSRAVADNTQDVVLQTNKGVNWAVAKIQVEAKQLVESYYQEYLNGKDLVIGKVGENTENAFVLNKTTCPESMVQYIESDQEITEDNKVYFIKEGVTVTYNVANNITSLIVVGDKPGVMSAIKTKKIISLTGETSGKGLIMYNMVLDATEHDSYVVNILKEADGIEYDYLYLVDKCRIKLPKNGGKNFAYINNKPKVSVKTLAMCNTYVNVQNSINGEYIITSYSNHAYNLKNVIMYNNVFYSPQSGSGFEKFGILTSGYVGSYLEKIYVVNNTYINLLGANPFTKAVIKGKLDVKNNLIWNDMNSKVNTTMIMAVKESDISQVTADNYSNNKLFSKNGLKASVFHTSGNTPAGLAGNNLSNEAADPFTGGKMLWDEGVFVLGPGYETVGAHIE